MRRDDFPEEGLNTQGHEILGSPKPPTPRKPWNLPLYSRKSPPDSGGTSSTHGLTGEWGACLLLPRLPRKLTMLSDCAKGQEPLLISLHCSICESVCSFNQHWLWVPAPDTKMSAKRGPKVRVDPGWLLGEKKAASCPRGLCCGVISQSGTLLHLITGKPP